MPRCATREQIKDRYRQLALVTHPDRRSEDCSEEFLQLQEAYLVLSVPSSRFQYDVYINNHHTLKTSAKPMASNTVDPTSYMSESEIAELERKKAMMDDLMKKVSRR